MVYGLILLLIVLLNLWLGIFVLSRGREREVNRTFCYWVICASIWNFMDFGLYFAPTPQSAIDWTKVLSIGVFFIPSTFFHFVLSYIRERGDLRRRLLPTAYIISSIFFLLVLSGLLVKGVTPLKRGYFPLFAGPPVPQLFILFFYGISLTGVSLLVRRYRRTTSSIEKNQLKYLLTGLLIAIVGAVSNFLLAFGRERIFPIGNVAQVAFIIMTTIAIVRYRLMDINVIIRPGLVYTTLTLLVTTLWLAGIFLFEDLLHLQTLPARIITIVIIVFLFNILRERVQLMVDKVFYRERHELLQLQERVTEEVTTIYDPDILVPSILKDIEDILHPQFISAMLLSSDGRSYSIKHSVGDGKEKVIFAVDDPLLKWLAKEKREIFSEEPDENPGFDGLREGVKKSLEKTKARLVVPLIYGDDLIGILNLGEKKGENKYYTHDEIAFLNTVVRELALALENTKLYADLKKRTVELEKANQIKSDFLNIVSHELKTPLTFIIGQIELSKRGAFGEVTQRQVESLKEMEAEGFKLNSLITDILDMAALESGGEWEVKTEEVHIEGIIQEIVEGFKLPVHDKGLGIEIDLPSKIPPILSDPAKIRDILLRLLDNAVKFTPAGGRITIGASPKDKDIEFFITDTGIGIKEDDQERIFERFFQVETSATRKWSGSGLGLSIASELVKVLGGEIKVQSSLHEGSKFIFTIPKEYKSDAVIDK